MNPGDSTGLDWRPKEVTMTNRLQIAKDMYRAYESGDRGDEVVATYEATRRDGSRFRNTEVLTFDGDKISKVEVYFGWNLT
jgi:ketosteroid isomerase-like protein